MEIVKEMLMLDLQKINESRILVGKIEELLVELDANMIKAAPDLVSSTETKKTIMNLLTGLDIVKEDLEKYKNGKSLKTEKEEAQQVMDIMKQVIMKRFDKKKNENGGNDDLPPLPDFKW